MRNNKKQKIQLWRSMWSVALLVMILLTGCGSNGNLEQQESTNQLAGVENPVDKLEPNPEVKPEQEDLDAESEEPESEVGSNTASVQGIPVYSGDAFSVLQDNEPNFPDIEWTGSKQQQQEYAGYEEFADLDHLGRCGVVSACITPAMMPTDKRESISHVKPSGWQSVKYDNVDGKYLYNRSHLIGFQLTGENANKENLITGTRFMNVDGMLPFENMVADYVKETGKPVLYRVTPVFEGDNLVASGVQMEAKSVEDNGESILYNVFVYNIQPGVAIDYTTGHSKAGAEHTGLGSAIIAGGETASQTGTQEQVEVKEEVESQEKVEETPEVATEAKESTFILNTNTKKFHLESCGSADTIKPEHLEVFTGTRQELLDQGYTGCKRCNP